MSRSPLPHPSAFAALRDLAREHPVEVPRSRLLGRVIAPESARPGLAERLRALSAFLSLAARRLGSRR